MNNEIRNILLNLYYLKKEIDKNEIAEANKREIDFYYQQTLERIKYLIDDDKKEHNYKMEMLKNNDKLLNAIKKGAL